MSSEMDVTHCTNNLSNICRVCLEESSKMYPLEGPILNVDVDLSTMITYCTSIEVILEDNLPRAVCLPCFRTIRIAYNFIVQFKENNRRLLAQREIKEENLENTRQYVEHLAQCQEQILEEDLHNEPSTDISNETNSPEENIIIKYVDDGENDSENDETSPVESILEKSKEEISRNEKPTVTVKSEKMISANKNLPRYDCPVCSNIFFNFKRGLVKHLYKCHKDAKFSCDRCSLNADLTVDLYLEHYTYAHLFQCTICKKKFSSKTPFYHHAKAHVDGYIDYKCPHCGKLFQNKVGYQKHLPTHSDIAKYVCSKCGKHFKTYDTFRYHIKTHDGKRSYLCSICGRSFLQSVHLKYHMQHHTGIKMHKCADCDKSYTSVTQLKKHRRKYCGKGES